MNYISPIDKRDPSFLSVVLSPQTEREASESHAVYIEAIDPIEDLAAYTYCFMVSNDGSDFCEDYCTSQSAKSYISFPNLEIYYFIDLITGASPPLLNE
jgi:hypothetical protein